MKRTIALLCLSTVFGMAMAQDVKTYSVYDTNQSGDLTVSDVTTVVDKVKKNVVATSTQQYVTADELKSLLEEINTKLERLNRLETWMQSISSTVGAKTPEEYEEYVKYQGHDYVEIGGLKWSTMNIGATGIADATEVNKSYVTTGTVLGCYGDYFQWGATDVSTSYKNSEYKQSTYNEEVLTEDFDIAKIKWGGAWRMPTLADFNSLINACAEEGSSAPSVPSEKITEGGIYWLNADQTLENEYTGVSGVLFVSRDNPSKRVFFPAAGDVCFESYFNSNNKLARGSSLCEYWSSNLYTSYTSMASVMNCSISSYSTKNATTRYIGLTVRPVAE